MLNQYTINPLTCTLENTEERLLGVDTNEAYTCRLREMYLIYLISLQTDGLTDIRLSLIPIIWLISWMIVSN